jgi:hypothetical protein
VGLIKEYDFNKFGLQVAVYWFSFIFGITYDKEACELHIWIGPLAITFYWCDW